MNSEIILLRRIEDLEKLIMRQPEVGGVWQDWTPTWSAYSGSPTIGNGTISGRYCKVGGLTIVKNYILFGSTTNFDSSIIWYLSNPTGIVFGFNSVGIIQIEDATDGNKILGQCRLDQYDNRIVLGMISGSSNWIGYNHPITFAEGDSIRVSYMY